jgi:hypothetical protein
MAKLVQVIEVEVSRGDGRERPIRRVTQYWSADGILLAEDDPQVGLDLAWWEHNNGDAPHDHVCVADRIYVNCGRAK